MIVVVSRLLLNFELSVEKLSRKSSLEVLLGSLAGNDKELVRNLCENYQDKNLKFDFELSGRFYFVY